jgi:hypothetical protein
MTTSHSQTTTTNPNQATQTNLLNNPYVGMQAGSVNAGALGSAGYNAGTNQYNYTPSNSQSAQNLSNQGLSLESGLLGQVQNPQQSMQQAQQVYANAEQPAYNLALSQALGQNEAQLGNRYNSTYGQLDMQQADQLGAMGQAQLQQNI